MYHKRLDQSRRQEKIQELDIDCGTYGSLTIFVCESCSSKFRGEEK